MSSTPTQEKPAAYINVAANVNFLQRLTCCNNSDMLKSNAADTPRNGSVSPFKPPEEVDPPDKD